MNLPDSSFSDFQSESDFRNTSLQLSINHLDILWARFVATLSVSDLQRIEQSKDFASSLEYNHEGMSAEKYLLHPLRVGLVAGRESIEYRYENYTVGVLHNIYEVSSVSPTTIQNRFGELINNALFTLKIDRRFQKDVAYLTEYYDKIKQLPLNLGKIKVIDKLDNLYSLLLTAKEEGIIEQYLNEIETFVIPLSNFCSPSLVLVLQNSVSEINKRFVGMESQ
jgi:(p)ppGpp synthase/HD superfamily hydrolase